MGAVGGWVVGEEGGGGEYAQRGESGAQGGMTEADVEIVGRVAEVAERRGWKMSQVALAWVRGRGAVPIVGLTSCNVQRLDEACAVREMRLSEEEMRLLEEPYVPKAVVGHV